MDNYINKIRTYTTRAVLVSIIGFFIVILTNDNLSVSTWIIGFITMCLAILTFVASFEEDTDTVEVQEDVIK